MPTPGPMNPLQVQLFVGAAAGRRARFDRSPITFGRDPSNLLVVDDALVSRRHGEIRFEGGHWVLANLSENGTKVNRRSADKPLPLKSGDEVFVGGKLLFNITIEPVETTAAGDLPLSAQPQAEGAAEAAPKKKIKPIMWMIPVYVIALLGLVIFLSTLKGKKGGVAEDQVPTLTRDQVAAIIRKPLKKEPLSELRYREALADAMRLFAARENISGRFESHRAFQVALSYSDRTDGNFPPDQAEAQLQYRQVQSELIERAYAAYEDGCNRLNRGDNVGAYHAFDKLKEMIPDGNNDLIQNAQDKQNIAVKRHGKKIKPVKTTK